MEKQTGVLETTAVGPELRSALIDIVGQQGCLFDPSDTAPYCEDWRQLYKAAPRRWYVPPTPKRWLLWFGYAPNAAFPSCRKAAIPAWSRRHAHQRPQIVLSLARMNKVRELDAVDLSMTIDAGVTLKAAQEAAIAADCMLPLSMVSEGSAHDRRHAVHQCRRK